MSWRVLSEKATPAGQEPDRERGQQAAEDQDRQWPPGRIGVVSEAGRQVSEDLLLQVVHEREEPVCRRGHRDADDRGQY